MPLQATPRALGLILQARPRHCYVSGERLRAAAGAWQVCCGPSLVLSQPHPLAFLKGLVTCGCRPVGASFLYEWRQFGTDKAQGGLWGAGEKGCASHNPAGALIGSPERSCPPSQV